MYLTSTDFRFFPRDGRVSTDFRVARLAKQALPKDLLDLLSLSSRYPTKAQRARFCRPIAWYAYLSRAEPSLIASQKRTGHRAPHLFFAAGWSHSARDRCKRFILVHLGINNPPVCHSSETSNLLSNGPEIPLFSRNDKFKLFRPVHKNNYPQGAGKTGNMNKPLRLIHQNSYRHWFRRVGFIGTRRLSQASNLKWSIFSLIYAYPPCFGDVRVKSRLKCALILLTAWLPTQRKQSLVTNKGGKTPQMC